MMLQWIVLSAVKLILTHCEEVGEGRCGSENLQQVSCTSEAVSNITELTLTLHLWNNTHTDTQYCWYMITHHSHNTPVTILYSDHLRFKVIFPIVPPVSSCVHHLFKEQNNTQLFNPLTLHPVAERVPGLAQVIANAVVHDAHMTKATFRIGVGGGVRYPSPVQPTCSTHV